jgi:sialidase-1
MKTPFLSVLLLTLATLAGCASVPERKTVTVFEYGTEGYNIYRIPAIVRAASGDLLAFCEARVGGDASEIDLVMKRSRDQGATWSALQVVQGRSEFVALFSEGAVPLITVGNPAPVVDLMDPDHAGRIWLPFNLENDRVFVTYSDDHGETWSPPREITSTVKREEWGWYAMGPVHSIQLQRGPYAGRLVIPVDHRLGDDGDDHGANGVHVVFSDDHGETWQLGAIDDTYEDGLSANETTVVELNDGRLYFNTRDQNGDAPGTRAHGYSSDGGVSFDLSGHSTYKYFVPSSPILDPPVVQSALLRVASTLDGDNRDLILFSGPDDDGPSGPGRSDLRIRYSVDEAETWHDGPLIHVGPAAYSDMVRLRADSTTIGILYEAGDAGAKQSRIDFTMMSFDELGK